MRTTRIYNYPSSADCTTATNDGLPERARIKPCRYWLSDFLVRRVLAHRCTSQRIWFTRFKQGRKPIDLCGSFGGITSTLGRSEFSGGTIDPICPFLPPRVFVKCPAIRKMVGRGGGDRTDDLFHAMEARSPLRHRPTIEDKSPRPPNRDRGKYRIHFRRWH